MQTIYKRSDFDFDLPSDLIAQFPTQQRSQCLLLNVLDENNFEILQGVLRKIFCLDSQAVGKEYFNPADKKAQEIADKIKRGRERIAAEKGENRGSMLSQYISSMVIGIQSMSLQDCLNLTLYQLLDLVERYSLYTDWDIDIRSRLAGASPDGQPENWMKNIH